MLVVVLAALAVSAGTIWAWQSCCSRSLKPVALRSWSLAIVLGQIVAIAIVWLPWSIARIGCRAVSVLHLAAVECAGRAGRCRSCGCPSSSMRCCTALAGRTPQEADEESIEEEIRTIVSEGHREGLLEEEAREMIEGVIELGDAVVSHIMTPRTEMHMIQVDTPWDEVVESVIESGHTRVPVYDKTRDDIVGILYSKDLLPELAKAPDEPRRPLRRTAAQAAVRAGNQAGRRPAASCSRRAARTSPSCWTSTAASPGW